MRAIRHVLWHGVVAVFLEIVNMLRFLLPSVALAFASAAFAGQLPQSTLPLRLPVVTEHSCRCVACQCEDCGKEPCPPARRIQPTVTREYPAHPSVRGAEPPLRAAIAGYRASGGQRAYVVGESDRAHLMREHGYAAAQLAGLTLDELQLLHGWAHAWQTSRGIATQRIAPSGGTVYQTPAPVYFGGTVGGGACAGGR